MKATLLTLVAAGIVSAQDMGDIDLPNCAIQCLTEALPNVGCSGGLNIMCACENLNRIIDDNQECFNDACETDELQEAQSAAVSMCNNLVGSTTMGSMTGTATAPETSGSGDATATATGSGSVTVTETTAATTVTTPSGSMPIGSSTNGTATGTATDTASESGSTSEPSGTDGGDSSGTGTESGADPTSTDGGDDGDSAAAKSFVGLAAAAVGILAAL